jgi:hypothetical protein
VKLPEPDVRQKAIGSALKTLIFISLAAPFVGVNLQLLLGEFQSLRLCIALFCVELSKL